MNRWWGAPVLWIVLSVSVRGGEGLRVPSTGTVTMDKKGASIRYPFGRVEIPKESVWSEKTELFPLGKLHAKTQGSFRLSYVLGREGDWIVAREVRVRVENKEKYLSPATPRLREHEAMHRRINEAEALRIQRTLESFRTRESDAVVAEERLKAEFRKQIASVEKLHAQWDDNHVFISSSTETEHSNLRPSPPISGSDAPDAVIPANGLSGGEGSP